MGTLGTLVTGACCAWPLPTDASCARVARQFYREAAAEAGIRAGLIDDGVLMASELAANTLHAGRDISGRDRFRPAAARPELWLYLRGSGMMRELVCKVFDACPGWRLGRIPGTLPHRAAAEAVSGRGLEVVHELSRGRWGHHLTRGRLGGRKVRGKAVWFALPVPSRGVTAPAPGPGGTWAADLGAMGQCRGLSADQAASELAAMLSARGLGSRLLRVDQAATDISVLWVPRGLTVCCRDGAVSLRTPAGDSQHWTYTELVEVTERAVCIHEEIGHTVAGAAGAVG